MDIDSLLRVAVMKEASDLHLKVGVKPIIRINGELTTLESTSAVTTQDLIAASMKILSPEQKEKMKGRFEMDLAYAVKGVGRFRLNIYQQRGSLSMVFRVVPTRINTIEELKLPKVLYKIAEENRGLILVTGATGSGKTTTLAAILDYINVNRKCNIISIEDPIEYLHNDKQSIISQREVGADTESFGIALRSALRQDPDVIMVGEMRDFETVSTAISGAETGHLVMSTLHTINSQETINRIISIFPPYQQDQIRMRFAATIKAIISIRLIPRIDGNGRVPAVEIMISTQTIKEAIIDLNKTRAINDIIANGKSQYGMQTFDQSLFELYQQEQISYEEALKWCTNPDDFSLKAKGIQSTSELTWAVEQEDNNTEHTGGGHFEIERF